MAEVLGITSQDSGNNSALTLCILRHRFGELDLVAGLIVNTEIPVSPRFSHDALRDTGTTPLKLRMQLIQLVREDV